MIRTTMLTAVLAANRFDRPGDRCRSHQDRRRHSAVGNLYANRSAGSLGLELAAKEVNAAGGIMGRQVQLIFEDEEANPSVAVQKAEKLFEVQKVDFLTGTVNSVQRSPWDRLRSAPVN